MARTPPARESIIHWLRRSRNRHIVLDVLAADGPASAHVIAMRRRLDVRVVRATLLGEGRRYARRRSLVRAGLVKRRVRRQGRRAGLPVFEATNEGRRALEWHDVALTRERRVPVRGRRRPPRR